jgi:anti-sigma regulatory factor (Ser/Thr protein kinase)
VATLPIQMHLDPDLRAPAVARHVVRGELEGVVDPELLDRAILLLSELVTNSVRHAGLGPQEEIQVTIAATARGLHVEVVEPGEGFEVGAISEPGGEGRSGGWGLYLVDRLSSAWGVSGGAQTRVWFEVVGKPNGGSPVDEVGPGG